MAGKTNIKGHGGPGKDGLLGVSDIGEAIVRPYDYDDTQSATMDAINTAFNLFVPASNKQFIITRAFVFADRSVSNTADATIILYEATSPTSITVSKILVQANLVRFGSLSGNLNLKVNPGMFINAKTDDATVIITVMGYRIPQVDPKGKTD